MIEAPKRSALRHWLQTGMLGLVSLAVVAGLAGTAAEVASQCQCHYTPVFFAQREGLERVVLSVELEGEQRARFIERLETLDVFVDPTYQKGTSSVAAVYSHRSLIPKLERMAREARR